ncbi:ribosome small subunit-dependent GTPase A [Fulvivirgaceae bacterium BMA12]|uniref:Small ribosomal subunit biogenesis GTPase RsgA n=1 Tax=Agaribacillus aureus TaxID=3051825 RepID=A0ABT8L3A7_9BACT|nr:ribosome small subunit-dependent GTPase A [Fulvivirgaceae bacterium BMA12]
MSNLYTLGFNQDLANYIETNNLNTFTVGRVAQQHRDGYIVLTGRESKKATITGNLRYTVSEKSELPVVGDWVLLIDSGDLYLIYQVLPRHTRLERQALQGLSESQLIASNIDEALIVQSVDQNFNLNRLERYISICHTGNIQPIIVLNKIDLIDNNRLNTLINEVRQRIPNVTLITTTTLFEHGAHQLLEKLQPQKTYCLVGSSGVGKSSLINALTKQDVMKTSSLSQAHQKGKHTTTHRELFVLDNGALIIDTPGMRELGVTESGHGLSQTFEQIDLLAADCQFVDCSHTSEPNCAVLEAIRRGELDEGALKNFKKLQRESQRFETSKAEKRKIDKGFSKMYKEVMKMRNKRRF